MPQVRVRLTVKPGNLKPLTPKVFLECYCLAESQSGVRKLNRKQELRLLCGFVASLRVLIFDTIGHNITNIPEIFQVLTVFSVAL